MAVQNVDGLLGPGDVEQMVRVWHRFPFYDAVNQRPSRQPGRVADGMAEGTDLRRLTPDSDAATPAIPGRFPGIAGRADVDLHFEQTGCAPGRAAVAAGRARFNYFAANYVKHNETAVPGIERFLDNTDLIEAARRVFGYPVVVPTLVYANLMLPGQELPVHTDIPEFLGADRGALPMWLLVAMHHSGLFAERRIATVTAVAYVEGCDGGEFGWYEEGELRTVTPGVGNAVVFDADTVFHSVLPIGAESELPPPNDPVMRLGRDGKRQWALSSRGERTATYSSDDLRFSVSLKAYCFPDEATYRAWQDGVDRLDPEVVLGRMVDELVTRGVLASPDHGLDDHALAGVLMDSFIPFPD